MVGAHTLGSAKLGPKLNEARERLADLPELPVAEWQREEQLLYFGYTMYERPMETRYGAIDEMARIPGGLDEEEAAELAMIQAGWFSLFEVARVKPGEAIEVRDVIRRRRFWISERTASRTLHSRGYDDYQKAIVCYPSQ